MNSSRRILLVAEAVRPSNAVHLAVLGRALHAAGYTVVLATDPRYRELVGELPFHVVPLRSAATPERVAAPWRLVVPLFDYATLERYVREDVRLIRAVAPDLVVGDMRPSLPVSARRQHVRYVSIVDPVYSSECALPFEPSELPLTDLVGRDAARGLTDFFAPVGMFTHALPGNLTRLRHGVEGWHDDVRKTNTDGDFVLYPDIPEIVPMKELPPNHRFIGPVLWSPKAPDPEWWDSLPAGRPVVWMSRPVGDDGLAPAILDGLASAEVTVVATAPPDAPVLHGRTAVRAAEHLDRAAMARRADLVVTGGGTTDIQESLAAGTPILAISEYSESPMYARAVHAKGAGEAMHAHDATADAVRHTAARMLAEPAFERAAAVLAASMARYNSSRLFVDFVGEALSLEPAEG